MARTRTHRRLEQPREQVLATTLDLIAEQGLAGVTMARLAERLGTSGGHLLYYFGTRDGLLLETLRWSEQRYAVEREPVLAAALAGEGASREDAEVDLLAFAEVYLPVDAGDPRWLLWVELWARAPYDADLAAAQRELDDEWHTDLTRLLAHLRPDLADPAGVSTRLRAMWDGFAVAIVCGGGLPLRAEALGHTRALLR